MEYALLAEKFELIEKEIKMKKTNQKNLPGTSNRISRLSPIKNRVDAIRHKLSKMKVNFFLSLSKETTRTFFKKETVSKKIKYGETSNMNQSNSNSKKPIQNYTVFEKTQKQNSKLRDLHDEKKDLVNWFLGSLVNEFRENNNFRKVLLIFYEKKIDKILEFVFRPIEAKNYKEEFMRIGKFTSQINI